MRKRFIMPCFVITLFSSSLLYAGPFGLEMGMTLKQIQKITDAKPTKSTNVYVVKKVPKQHNSIEYYNLFIGSKSGLCKINAVSKDISTSSYGTEFMSSFEAMENSLKAKYGENKKYDYLKRDSIWSKDNEWTMALKLKERILVAFWDKEIGANMSDSIVGIELEANGLSQQTGYYTLSYQFSNFSECKDEREKNVVDAL